MMDEFINFLKSNTHNLQVFSFIFLIIFFLLESVVGGFFNYFRGKHCCGKCNNWVCPNAFTCNSSRFYKDDNELN